MAGGVLKGFGGLFLALGILLLLIAGGAAAFALVDQNNHKQDAGPFGVAEDPNRSERNGDLLEMAAVAAAAGLVLLLLGIVLLAAGGGRANRALQHSIRTALAAPAATAPAAAAPAPQPQGSGGKGWVAAGMAVLALLVLLALVTAQMGGPATLRGEGRSDPDSLGGARLSGSTSTSLTVLGGTRGAGDGHSQEEFDAPAGAGRLQATVAWQPGAQGPQRLQVYIDRLAGGAWTAVGDWEGKPGFSFNLTDPALSGARLRFRAFPADDGATALQPFTLDVAFWRA